MFVVFAFVVVFFFFFEWCTYSTKLRVGCCIWCCCCFPCFLLLLYLFKSLLNKFCAGVPPWPNQDWEMKIVWEVIHGCCCFLCFFFIICSSLCCITFAQVYLLNQLRTEFGGKNDFTTALHYVQQKVSSCQWSWIWWWWWWRKIYNYNHDHELEYYITPTLSSY